MYNDNRSPPLKWLGGQHQNFKKIGKIKVIVETVQLPFGALDMWTLGFIKYFWHWQTYEVLPHQNITKGLKRNKDTIFLHLWILSQSNPSENDHGKDNMRNDYVETWGQAWDITMASQKHCNDNKNTKGANLRTESTILPQDHSNIVMLLTHTAGSSSLTLGQVWT